MGRSQLYATLPARDRGRSHRHHGTGIAPFREALQLHTIPGRDGKTLWYSSSRWPARMGTTPGRRCDKFCDDTQVAEETYSTVPPRYRAFLLSILCDAGLPRCARRSVLRDRAHGGARAVRRQPNNFARRDVLNLRRACSRSIIYVILMVAYGNIG